MVVTTTNNTLWDPSLTIPKPSRFRMYVHHLQGMQNTKLTPTPVDLSGKWVFISGSNSGIGRRAVLQFASWGANIALACREPPSHELHPSKVVEECQQAAKNAGHVNSTIEWWEVDYGKLSSVEEVTKRWLDTGRPIDLLCNNAALGNLPAGGTKFVLTEDGYEVLHQVNLLAHVLLTLRLLPAVTKARQPRIVCTVSSGHYIGNFDLANFHGEKIKRKLEQDGKPLGMEIYHNNKLWFMTWVAELQRRCLLHDETRHITVNGCHPGYVFTGMGMERLNDASKLKRKLMLLIAPYVTIDDYQGSMCIIYAATTPEAGADPRIQNIGASNGRGGGRYFNRIWEKAPNPYVQNSDCRLWVWKLLNDTLKLKEKGLLDILGVD
jgi:NAD(P)-dependent dehydrogenase (short-subunit alcohol dehydrogenase family)